VAIAAPSYSGHETRRREKKELEGGKGNKVDWKEVTVAPAG